MRCYCDLWSSPLCPGPGLCSPRVVLRPTRLKATPRHLWSEQRSGEVRFTVSYIFTSIFQERCSIGHGFNIK